jgi:hypothetical protein
MAFRAPLTTAQLHEIGARRDANDILALLWEIKRLRGLVLRANQVIRPLTDIGGPNGIVRECLKKDFLTEPCVMDEERRRLDSL